MYEHPVTEESDFDLLERYVPAERVGDYRAYVKELYANFGHVFVVDETSPGFIDDYMNYAALLKRKAKLHGLHEKCAREICERLGHTPLPNLRPPLTVYDVGCGTALQHLLFDPAIHYVGIDMYAHVEPRFFRPNCRFVHGRFADVAEGLQIDTHNSVGIANMSLLYYRGDGDDLPVFDRTFRHKFVL